MADCENVRFCGMHGEVLDDNMVCQTCAKQQRERRGSPERCDGYVDGQKTNNLARELEQRNKTPWSEAYWVKYHINSVYPDSKYFCDHCRYWMAHRLEWCPLCGQRFRHEKLTYKELVERYADYRQGF